MNSVKVTSHKNPSGQVEARIELREPNHNSILYRVFIAVSADGTKGVTTVEHRFDPEMTRILGKPFYEITGRVTRDCPVAEGWTKKEVVERITRRLNL